jgi:tRNA 2-selenouridine synthase
LNQINIDELLKFKDEIALIDVRSPAEYSQGHIPGGINIPLFDNDERAIVGTLYKKSGQREAVLSGLEIAGRKIRLLAEKGLKIAKNDKLIIHCWRGGMRSSSVAWLLETTGINCYIIKDGYKSYRKYVCKFFSFPFNLIVLGGLTGSGKSAILNEIEANSYQVLKLEELANHKGSAFGNIGEDPQNSTEQFENDLFTAINCFDLNKPIFVEDESRNIGKNIIPKDFFEKMSLSPLVIVNIDKKLRITRLVEEYSHFPKQKLEDSIEKISKRLGGHNTFLAIKALNDGQPEITAEISLNYYDKSYNFGLSQKRNKQVFTIRLESSDAKINAKIIIDFLKESRII